MNSRRGSGWWWVAGWCALWAGTAQAEPSTFVPSAESREQEQAAWRQWRTLAGTEFFLSYFIAPDPVELLIWQQERAVSGYLSSAGVTMAASALQATLTALYSPWIRTAPVTVSCQVARWQVTREDPLESTALELGSGLQSLTEDQWETLRPYRLLIARRTKRLQHGTKILVISRRYLDQRGEAERLAPELDHFTFMLMDKAEWLSRMKQELNQAYSTYEEGVVEQVRRSATVTALRTALKALFQRSEPHWEALEERVLAEGFPPEEDFAIWKQAVLEMYRLRHEGRSEEKPGDGMARRVTDHFLAKHAALFRSPLIPKLPISEMVEDD